MHGRSKITALVKNKKLVFASLAIAFLLAAFFLFRRGKAGPEETVRRPRTIIHGDNLARGETLIAIFARRGVPAENYYSVIGEFSKVYNARRMQAGHYYEIALSTENKILEFSYRPEVAIKYTVILTTTGYKAQEIKMKIHKRYFGFSGTVQSNLYNSMISAGVNPTLIMTFADIFESRISFLTDQRPGDRFFIVFEQSFTERGQEVDRGTIIVGKYIMAGGRRGQSKEFTAFAFPRGGLYEYYDPSGKSLSTQFLSAPLSFRRISSHFTNRRYHPILRYYRPHQGIDYAAPRGTPVSTIGDGQVIFIGRNGDYGKQVKIRHNAVYESWYAHLSRYGAGIKRGDHVKKGQVIGYVGSTGLSTGPHLDFRVKQRGRFVNFLTLKLPPARSLTKKEMDEFQPMRQKYYRYMAELSMHGKFKYDKEPY